MNFSKAHQLRDPGRDGPPLTEIYATRLRSAYASELEKAEHNSPATRNEHDQPAPDAERAYRSAAIQGLRLQASFWKKAHSTEGIKWGSVQSLLASHGPGVLTGEERFEWARNVVKEALDTLLGSENIDYMVEKRADGRKWITTRSGPSGDPGGPVSLR